MSPEYLPGDVVVFSPTAVERDDVVSGKDYAVRLESADFVFRRIFVESPDTGALVLKTLNPHREVTTRVPRKDVVAMARAIWISKAGPADDAIPHIESTPGVRGGRPRIAGRRITVDDVVIMNRRLGHSVDEIVAKYDLSFAEVHAALAYYYGHQAEIDQRIADDDAFVEAFKRNNPSKLQDKLRALRDA
jgi:uncharacterized protein (DUF433 family)